MDTLNTTLARQIADSAIAFRPQRTGHSPQSLTVVHAATGVTVQVFHLAKRSPMATPSGAASPTDADHDAGNTAGFTRSNVKEDSCQTVMHP